MASSYLTCTICANKFKEPEELCSTICGHIFHSSCMLQWQESSNACPFCTQSDPRPHRLFLDIAAASTSKTVNKQGDNNEHLVIIKGIQPHLIVTSLSDLILDFARMMNVSISHSDIKNVSKKDKNHVHVIFYNVHHKNVFLQKKFLLKSNSETSGVDIQEPLDKETKKLFQHAHNLKQCGYKIFYIKDRKIYAKKGREKTAIIINSMEQVDLLCAGPCNSSSVRYTTKSTGPIRQSASTSTNPFTQPTAPSHGLSNSSPLPYPRPVPHTVLTPHTASVSTNAAQYEIDSESAILINTILLEDILLNES